ncbi:hypothetical protein [Azospirillum doebereinerae]
MPYWLDFLIHRIQYLNGRSRSRDLTEISSNRHCPDLQGGQGVPTLSQTTISEIGT